MLAPAYGGGIFFWCRHESTSCAFNGGNKQKMKAATAATSLGLWNLLPCGSRAKRVIPTTSISGFIYAPMWITSEASNPNNFNKRLFLRPLRITSEASNPCHILAALMDWPVGANTPAGIMNGIADIGLP
jgi:hypothetical protein